LPNKVNTFCAVSAAWKVCIDEGLAFENTGLRDNGNYTRYKKIDRDYIAGAVQVCDAISFFPY
jgi:hypothetical protein